MTHYLESTIFFTALSPHIDLQRSHLVDHYADEWASRFSLAISMATGSPARLAAINASLRQYQPAYMHLPLVKSFFWDGDFHAQLQSIQYITFDSVEGTPPVPVSEVDEECRALVEEIRAYAERFLRVVQARRRAKPTSSEQPHLIPWVSAGGGAPAESIPTVPALSRGGSGDTLDGNPDGEEGDYDHELMDFWLRKTRKPVLAVVLVRRGTNPHAERRYFRAMNLEVCVCGGGGSDRANGAHVSMPDKQCPAPCRAPYPSGFDANGQSLQRASCDRAGSGFRPRSTPQRHPYGCSPLVA